MVEERAPDIVRVIDEYRKALIAGDQALAENLVASYARSWNRVRAQLARVTTQIDAAVAGGEAATKGMVTRLWRAEQLSEAIQAEIVSYSAIAGDSITAAQLDSMGLSQIHAEGLVDAALPPGVTRNTLARAGLAWNDVPAAAVESLVGALGDGSPLTSTLSRFGPTVANGVRESLVDGMIRGVGPRVVARGMQNAYGIGLTKALTIARTETLRGYREGTRAAYKANSDVVKGYRRSASQDDRTCMGCIASDGQFFRSDVSFPGHVNCRCVMVPVTTTYKELGIDLPDPADGFPSARDWFVNQPASTQQFMMGNKAWRAWDAGDVPLDSFVHMTIDPVWGSAQVPATLTQMGIA